MLQRGTSPAHPLRHIPCIFPLEQGNLVRDRSAANCLTHHLFPRIASVREIGRGYELFTRYPWVVRVCLAAAQLETRLP